MKKKTRLIFFLAFCILICFDEVRAFGLIDGYKVVVNDKTEFKIRQVEVKPVSASYTVSIRISNNTIVIGDTTDKALLFCCESEYDVGVLKNFKEKCLDNLADANCLNEFVERFYTMFDPFGLECFVPNKDSPMLIKLVKEKSLEGFEAYPNPVTNFLHLRSSTDQIGRIQVYDVMSGRQVLSANFASNESSLDCMSLKRGNYIIVCGENRIQFVKK